MNTAISYTQFESNLNETCHQVCHNHTPVFVERNNGEKFVLLAKEDYLALLENIYFLKASESVLETVWDNADDAEYDKL